LILCSAYLLLLRTGSKKTIKGTSMAMKRVVEKVIAQWAIIYIYGSGFYQIFSRIFLFHCGPAKSWPERKPSQTLPPAVGFR